MLTKASSKHGIPQNYRLAERPACQNVIIVTEIQPRHPHLSREAAIEGTPRRKPWVKCAFETDPRTGRKINNEPAGTACTLQARLLPAPPSANFRLEPLRYAYLPPLTFSNSSVALSIAIAILSSTSATMGTWASASFHFSWSIYSRTAAIGFAP